MFTRRVADHLKTSRGKVLLVVPAFFLAVVVASCGGANLTNRDPASIRDARYCEIIPTTISGATQTSWVYSTAGINDCPAAQWDTLTEEQVNAEYGSVSAKLNGPRYWVMDEIVSEDSEGDSFTFGGIEMTLRGKIETPTGGPTVGDQLYVPNQVQRNTIYTYDAGTLVFELTSPEGDVYIMQAYSQIVDPNLTLDQLPELGSNLTLPAGWRYSTRRLFRSLHLDSGGVAYVVNDSLLNSYQRE